LGHIYSTFLPIIRLINDLVSDAQRQHPYILRLKQPRIDGT
jgi:hypothetical protein